MRNIMSGLTSKNWPFLAGGLIVLLYFAYFVLPSLNGGFRNDDAYNIYYYWSRGAGELLQSVVMFYSSYYRPMGGIYFYSLYELFGLDPFPYHAVIVCLLFINVILVYRCATILSGSKITGGLCSVLMAYHARLALLAYVPAFIFDVLCFTFFFLALFFYLRIRGSGLELSAPQTAIFILIYLFALESKEMAVSLPVMIMLYEVLWHTPERSVKGVLTWLRTQGVPVLASGFVTLCFIIGKSSGPEALSNNPAYQLTITFKRFFESNIKYVEDIFYLEGKNWVNIPLLLILWALLAYVALSMRKRHLIFSLAMTVITALPITFIPQRGDTMLYIPCFGWALLGASFTESLCANFSRKSPFRRLNRNLAKALLLLLSVSFFWTVTHYKNKNLQYALNHQDREFRVVKEQLEERLPKVKPGSRIVFYNDIFKGWEAKFIAELLYKDRSVTARLHEKTPLSLSELNKVDYVLAFEQEKLVILKRPGESFIPPR